uniref:Mediator of RNA polymerase II transcription subunit 1 n=1 Tax=Glossina brevipalpis TaxID=37001 RepID=A0A1A9W550_9MUSC
MSAVNNKLTAIGAGSINPTALLTSMSNAIEKNKQWQRELLMERIRSHSSQHKTFQELSKAMRMGMLEKRYALDAVEKSNLQKCLDSMQHCIKVTSRQGLVERLESLSRQLGLKFMDDTKVLFISTDMFFLEIVLDANGALSDVKVHHECKVEQQSCSELVDCLNRGDFADFTAQLEGFSSIYQLNAEPKVKTKAFDAMQAVETDLYNLFQMQSFSKDTQQVLKDSIVGIVLKRHGGHPMRLVYFVSPYDLISLESKSLQALSLDLLHNKQIGFSVTVNLEASSANKLQILPTVSFAKESQSGLEVPVFAPLNQMNSMLLPATFVLRLNKPLPVCYNTLRAMGLCSSPSTSQVPAADINNSTVLEGQHKATLPMVSNIMSLIIYTASEQQLKNSQKGLFVCLPDQTHCYFFTENKLLKSTLVHSIPFTEPSQVPKILDFLKRQALFYALLSSCIRPQSKIVNDIDSTIILEVNAISYHQISVALQHPYEESMATVEFDLHNGNVQCIIYSLSNNYDLLSLKLTNVVQKCCSIPVTIRALLRYWDQERMKKFQRGIGAAAGSTGANTSNNGSGAVGTNNAYGNFNIAGVTNDPGGGGGGVGGGGGGCMNRGLGGSVKIEQPLQQRTQLANATTGYLKYKCGDIKQEDFHESPKSQTLAMVTETAAANSMPVREVSSLGQQQQQTTHETFQQQANTTFTAEREIVDKYKNIWKDKTPAIKNCLSITPIGTQHDAMKDVKRTGGIEIIPLTGQQHNSIAGTVNNGSSTAVSNSSTGITITPINAGSSSMSISGVSGKDKKSSTTSSTCISNLSSSTTSTKRALDVQGELPKEKKRKKKRDDSPMGPPEKIYSRQNSPAGSSEAAAGAVARKFSSPSSSPKGSSGGLLASTVTGSSLTTRPSPKHSPVYSSPKHNTASNSPKSPFGTHSPKHSSSGKPSMSTLKNATAASPKGDKSSTTAAIGSSSSSGLNTVALVRSSTSSTVAAAAAAAAAAMAALKSKDKSAVSPAAVNSAVAAAAAAVVKSSMGVVTPTIQLKNISSLNHMAVAPAGFGGNTTTVSSLDLNAAMRKSVPSAVSLMTSTAVTATVNSTSTQRRAIHQVHRHQQRPVPLQPLGSSESDGNTFNKNSSEYMVKSQSQEGLKLTINKTKAISTKKFSINNDPACKKFSASEKSWSPSQSRHTFQKSNSSGNLAGKLNKSRSLENNIEYLSNDNLRKCIKKSPASASSTTSTHMPSLSASPSQSALRIDYHADMMKILQYASPTMAASMEGFMKSLNTKFQIPKLSQRNTTKTVTATTTAASVAETNKIGSLCAATNTTSICPSSTTRAGDVQTPSLSPSLNASSQQPTITAADTPIIASTNKSLVSLHVLKSSSISSTSPNHINSLTAAKSALNFVDNSNVPNNSMCNESLLATLAGE